ncbi:general transcription factor II-I repeat domain-containing protein 2-like [Anomaloglossus baeobatrachus]|uniref:general transcription factor II-I repeat domain-containing protein 2-like n=1 Tax=Anomaloglossus baeobatrachus TaxID=238106 RepID=UPI003F5044EF
MASAMSSKKRKIADEKRIFQDKWEQLYFVTEVGAKVQCLICFQFIAVLKDYNVRRHYMTHHGEQYEALSGKLRDEKVQQLKASLKKQRNLFSSINKASETSVKASFVLSNMIAKSSRPFTEGQFIKDCFVKASEILCPDKTKLFEGISLSANTVASRITESASNIHQQLITAAQSFEAFSIALDESTGVTDTAYCAVFIRGVDENLNIIEEFLDLLPMKGTTTGRDIFKELEDCINTAGLPWDKLVSVVTDGAPAMCSENIGVVGLLKAKRNQLSLSGPFSAIHCILHQEALCGKSVQLKEVMDFVVKTVNFIRARGLNHRQFTSFLSDMDTEYGDLLYHTEVRWLSRGRVLKRFFSLREEIALFMALKDNDVFQLSDPAFLSDLAFLTDVTEHLNELNLKLQGQKHIITIMFDSVKAFKCKLSLWAKQLQSGNLAHFSAMQSLVQTTPDRLKMYSDIILQLLQEFNRRFHDFQDLETEFALFATPFAVDVSCVSEDLQMELVDLQCDTVLKQKYMDIGVPDFYKFVSQEKFPKLVKAAARIMAMFGSTYVCEQFFSSMKLNKSALRSRLTDEHLRATLRLATAHDFKPQVDMLVSGKRSQLSSQTGVCHT